MSLIPVTAACIIAAAQAQNVHPASIITIMKVEGGKVGEYSTNKNGTRDLGPMQINDRVWIPTLAKKHFKGDEAKTEYALLNDGCYNVYAGSYILRTNIDRAGGDLVEGVGLYHSSTEKHKKRYIAKFLENFNLIFNRRGQ